MSYWDVADDENNKKSDSCHLKKENVLTNWIFNFRWNKEKLYKSYFIESLSIIKKDEKLHNGDSGKVDGMGFIVSFEGGPVRYEVIVIFEEREPRREGK